MTGSSKRYTYIYLLLGIILLSSFLVSLRYGAVWITSEEILSGIGKALSGGTDVTLNERVFMQIRLPRALLTVLVGAALSVGGVLIQGLFRNPIVEPGLIGISSGSAFGAALYFVLGASFQIHAGEWTLPVAACLGGILATVLVISFANVNRQARTSIVTLLLVGIAINALFLSGVGLMSYLARDPQARSIAFWNLGTLSGASWTNVSIVSITTSIAVAFALRYAKDLNALMIGEEEAAYLGVDPKKLKLKVLFINIILISVATSFTGIISFVGLVVPHFLRIIGGSDHRFLLKGSAIAGAALLCISDLLSRVLLQPAEMPIGIITSVIGVPVFIFLLRTKKYSFL